MADKLGPFLSDTTGRMMVESLEGIKDVLRVGLNQNPALDDIYVAMLDGTRDTYRRVMRSWFLANGAETASAEELTALCDKWYRITRSDWTGGQTYTQPTDSTAPYTGEKFGDNAGLNCMPSTTTVKNTDDYEGLPLFAVTDCNWTLSATGEILITAIDGITSGFERYNPEKFVGVLQQSCFVLRSEGDTAYSVGVSAKRVAGYDYCRPLPESVKKDGSIREWVCHSKYQAGMVNSKPTACSGVAPMTASHNSIVSDAHIRGPYYSGTCHCDYDFLELMKQVKYSLASDGVLQGCCDYYRSAVVACAESNVKRVLLSSNPGFIVGSTVKVGTATTDSQKTDRNLTALAHGKVKSIETVAVDGVAYTAINLDVSSMFTTVLGASISDGQSVIMTMPWISGSTDLVDANDGGISPTSSVYPVKLQGIEYMVGQYEVVGDTILQYESDGQYDYIIADATKGATSITSDFVKHGGTPTPSSSSWQYVKKMGYDGAFYPKVTGGSSSIGHRDAAYILATTSGQYELLLFGGLSSGSGHAGLSCSARNDGLSARSWAFGSRLSPNGNRGEWSA